MKFLAKNCGNLWHFPIFSRTSSRNFEAVFHFLNISAKFGFRQIFFLFFFFRAHRTKDHTRKQEKVGPFECDVLEKQSRVSARCYPLTVRILYNGKRKRTPKRQTNHDPYSTDPGSCFAHVAEWSSFYAKIRKFLEFSEFFWHFFAKYRDNSSFPEHCCEIPVKFSSFSSFFLRAHRTKDHTRKQEKVGPFECDVLEKQSRVSARCYPLTVRILHNGKRKRTPKRQTNHEPYSTDPGSCYTNVAELQVVW